MSLNLKTHWSFNLQLFYCRKFISNCFFSKYDEFLKKLIRQYLSTTIVQCHIPANFTEGVNDDQILKKTSFVLHCTVDQRLWNYFQNMINTLHISFIGDLNLLRRVITGLSKRGFEFSLFFQKPHHDKFTYLPYKDHFQVIYQKILIFFHQPSQISQPVYQIDSTLQDICLRLPNQVLYQFVKAYQIYSEAFCHIGFLKAPDLFSTHFWWASVCLPIFICWGVESSSLICHTVSNNFSKSGSQC